MSQQQLKAAFDGLNQEIREALQLAADRIRTFHEAQKQDSWTYVDDLGNTLGQKVTPLDRVGIYVPGGLASYPSSVLMNAVPAHVAGVPEIIMVVPAPNGELNPLVLAAAYLAGVSQYLPLVGHKLLLLMVVLKLFHVLIKLRVLETDLWQLLNVLYLVRWVST